MSCGLVCWRYGELYICFYILPYKHFEFADDWTAVRSQLRHVNIAFINNDPLCEWADITMPSSIVSDCDDKLRKQNGVNTGRETFMTGGSKNVGDRNR